MTSVAGDDASACVPEGIELLHAVINSTANRIKQVVVFINLLISIHSLTDGNLDPLHHIVNANADKYDRNYNADNPLSTHNDV